MACDAHATDFRRYDVTEHSRDSQVKWALDQVRAELDQAMRAFPPMRSPHEGWAILREEVDEMWDEIKRNDFDGGLEEAIQVAAMAIRYIHDLADYDAPKSATLRVVRVDNR